MDGRAFLAVAQDLVAYASEAHWRTAAVSAYYALMLEARDRLQDWGLAVPVRQHLHAAVRLSFAYAANPDLKHIGDALDELVRLRNEAHYRLGTPGRFANNQPTVGAITVAQKALAVLSRIHQDPAQQAAAVAAIRAGGS
jgi:hypothetical protein